MKKSFALNFLWVLLLGAVLSFPVPASGAENSLMLQAQKIVHQAWNPGGETLSNSKRLKLLAQALAILENDPYPGKGDHKTLALRYISSAVFELKLGDTDKNASDYLHSAYDELQSALTAKES